MSGARASERFCRPSLSIPAAAAIGEEDVGEHRQPVQADCRRSKRPTDPKRVGQHGLEIAMAVSQAFSVQREPVGKRITGVIELVDDPRGDQAGRQPS